MLFASTVAGMIIYTYYYYYFVSADSEAPIFGAALMIVYGFIALAVAAVGTVVVVIKDRYAEKTGINEEVENMKAIAGFFGADGRYLHGLIPINEAFVFPIKTLIINVHGCIAIGVIALFTSKHTGYLWCGWLGSRLY
jgi:hypothetical protein